MFTMNSISIKIFIFVLICVKNGLLLSQSMQVYLSNRLNYTNNSLKTSLPKGHFYSAGVEFKSQITTEIPDIYSTATIFSLFNSFYVLLGIKLYYLVPANDNFELQFQSEFSIQDHIISFVQTIEYENTGIVLMAFQNGYSRIYGISNITKEWFFIHSIDDLATPIAASFFYNNFHLYLVIASTKANSLAFSKIYKWMGTHFDEIDRILTEGTTSLITFPSGLSQIIIFQQQTTTGNAKSVIYEFNEDKLRKKQLIVNYNARHMITYKHRENTFVALFGESATNFLYFWDGSELLSWSEITTCDGIEKIFVFNKETASLVFISQRDQLLIYRPSTTNISLIKKVKYKRTFQRVFDLHVVKYHDIYVVVIVGIKANNKLDFIEMPFELYYLNDEHKTDERSLLLQCFRNIEKLIKDTKYDINDLNVESKRIIQKNEPLEFHGKLQVDSSNFEKPPVVQSSQRVSNFDQQIFEVNNNILELSNRLDDLIQSQDSLFTNTSDILNGKLIVRGSLFVKKFMSNNMNIKKLNDIEWLPNKWLSYSQTQTISAHVGTKSLIADKVSFPNKNGTLGNLLLSEGEQTITGNCQFDFFATHNLRTERINDISFHDLYIQSHPSLISGTKSFNRLIVDNINTPQVNNHSTRDFANQFSNEGVNVYIKNLVIENIDNVHWNAFQDSVFRIGINQNITAKLVMPSLKTNDLNTIKINGIKSDSFLTIATNQTVSSQLQVTYINAKNVIAKEINGINFSNVATTTNNEIKGPISVDNLIVNKTLFLNDRNEVDHNGKDELDFLQIYNGKVKISGNLHVKSISLLPSAQMVINSKLINESVDNFWSKSKSQKIPVHFEALNGASASHLIINNLNSIPINNYLLNNLEDQLPVNIVFENITVWGNININRSQPHNPDLIKLREESVKISGEYVVKGQKVFQGHLEVENLQITTLDDINVENVVNINNLNEISNRITFDQFEIEGNLFADAISTPSINQINLTDLQEHTLYVDTSESLVNLDFNTISVDHLNTIFINKNHFKDYTGFLNNTYASDTISTLIIDGNVTLTNVYGLSTINNHSVNNLLDNDGIQRRNVIFTDKVYVNNLFATMINGIDLPKLTQRILLKGWSQNITAPYSFDNVITKNLITWQINNYSVNSIIDTKEEQLQFLRGNIHLVNGEFESINSIGLTCDIHQAAMNIKNPSINTYWENVYVTNNITMMNSDFNLYRIINNVVRRNGNNTIKSKVTFKNPILANNIYVDETINQIHLSTFIDDAVLRTAEDQIISGRKTFGNLSVYGAVVIGNADLPKVNNISLIDLNRRIIPKNPPQDLLIKGVKTFFGGIETKYLITDNISSIATKDLVTLSNLKTIPNVYFHKLDIEGDFNFNLVNNINLSDVMTNRILRTSSKQQIASGVYYFDDILIIGNNTISKINDIDIEDIVYNTDIQNINSIKHFTQDVKFNSNIQVDVLNKYEIDNVFKNAITRQSNVTLENAKFLSPVKINGNLIAESINHIPVEDLHELLSTTPHIKMRNVQSILKQIGNTVGYSLELIQNMPQRYLYVEESVEFQISLPNIINAQVVQAKENVMLNVMGLTTGSFCGLPKHCNCPVQQTMEITSHLSVHTLTETGSERIFSYDDEDESINLFTNGVSINSDCRLNNSRVNEEYSTIVWNLHNPRNQSGASYNYFSEYLRGYISGVEYFSSNNHTYAIITRYYDPYNDTHSINGAVLKFLPQSGKIEFIQHLPTKRAWTTHLFHTAQGIIVIIGSISDSKTSHEPTGFDIYRFNKEEEKFLLLRNVFGSSSKMAVGVAIEADSLIILAQNHYPLQVLKYHPKYDNYYFYQNIFLDSPVSSLSVFYTQEYGISDAYLCAVSENGAYFLYTFRYLEGWRLEFNGEIDGLNALIPFQLNTKTYLFASSSKSSVLLNIIKQGHL